MTRSPEACSASTRRCPTMPLAPAIATVRDSSALGFVVIVSPFKFSVCEMHNHRHCVAVCQTQRQHLPMQHLQTKFCALHVPPNDVAGIFARRIRGQHEEAWLDILLGGPEAVGLNPEQRKAVEMTGINLLHVEAVKGFYE